MEVNCLFRYGYECDESPYGEAVLILVLFRVLFLVSNEAKECSTPNSTPLVGICSAALQRSVVCGV